MVTPLGADLVKSAAVEEGKLIALDRGCALEMVQAQDVMTDYDKLIDIQQLSLSTSSLTTYIYILLFSVLKISKDWSLFFNMLIINPVVY